jgi:hypothetical protein
MNNNPIGVAVTTANDDNNNNNNNNMDADHGTDEEYEEVD